MRGRLGRFFAFNNIKTAGCFFLHYSFNTKVATERAGIWIDDSCRVPMCCKSLSMEVTYIFACLYPLQFCLLVSFAIDFYVLFFCAIVDEYRHDLFAIRIGRSHD